MAIVKLRIHPAIGIGRLGNSPEHFVGPELPGDTSPPAGGYKDSHCRVKRQAARYRLFAYDESDNPIGEITSADADISWTVEIANKKAAWFTFNGLQQTGIYRNGSADPAWVIAPGAKTVSGVNQAASLNGAFQGQPVELGEMRTDAQGRLLVLGGRGRSSSPSGTPLIHYANNPGWHDDTSDGRVSASVKIDGNQVPVESAWFICGPPDFAPGIPNVVTLYDTLLQRAVDDGLVAGSTLVDAPPAQPSFTKHVWPILQRTLLQRFVTSEVVFGPSPSSPSPHAVVEQALDQNAPDLVRKAVADRMGNPYVGSNDMPKYRGDNYADRARVTKIQYDHLQAWKAGNFVKDWAGPPAPDAAITPAGLDRAALEACCGAACFPGMEAGWMLRDDLPFAEPFRLAASVQPGDVTKQMAVPWQADFYDCRLDDGIAWWPAQRPDNVVPEGATSYADWHRDLAESWDDMVANWHKLGFVLPEGAGFVEKERKVVCKAVDVITDRSHVSRDEVEALLDSASTALFDASFYAVVEGFLPAELGITTATPTAAQLAAIAPAITLLAQETGAAPPGVTAVPQALLLQDPSLPPQLRQRFTFRYALGFTGTAAFFEADGTTPRELTNVLVTAEESGQIGQGLVQLVHQPNPYMLDGATHWLSTDLRVFQIEEGQSKFGQTIGNDGASAVAFVQGVLAHLNSTPNAEQQFETQLSTDQQASRLELSRTVNGKRVFNFAVAQVRYRGKNLPATDVRVSFRAFTTAATGLDYQPDSTYRTGTAGPVEIALPGLQAGEIVTIPFFATERVDSTSASLTTQTDAVNVRTLAPQGGAETTHYFGCWLDLNQTEPRYPVHPSPVNGPFAAGPNLRSIQELIRGQHQCLVAEVRFSADPIPLGATPGANDNLSQRNLAIVESDNPGGPDSHRVQHTLDIRAAAHAVTAVPRDPDAGLTHHAVARESRVRLPELLLHWEHLPPGTRAALFVPDLDAHEIVRLARTSQEAHGLTILDDHTIGMGYGAHGLGQATYVPLPDTKRNVAALLTVDLPDGVKRGQLFHLVAHQIEASPRRVLGSVQVTIPVSSKEVLLEGEQRSLSVLRHIARTIPVGDRWHPVFHRYLEQIGARVRAFGGDPDRIEPSPDGGEAPWEAYGERSPEPCASTRATACDGLRLQLPWRDLEVDGALRLTLRFRRSRGC